MVDIYRAANGEGNIHHYSPTLKHFEHIRNAFIAKN